MFSLQGMNTKRGWTSFCQQVSKFLAQTQLRTVVSWLPELNHLLEQQAHPTLVSLPSSRLDSFVSISPDKEVTLFELDHTNQTNVYCSDSFDLKFDLNDFLLLNHNNNNKLRLYSPFLKFKVVYIIDFLLGCRLSTRPLERTLASTGRRSTFKSKYISGQRP